uniref:Coiled-coil domain-containing protein 78-like n=1 Tax=Sinocyclocheilus anshuiensis TaxID=1608454 RepID=A0A671LG93_9TELE
MDSTNKHSSINELQKQIHSLTEENVQLQERDEVLFSKLESIQNKLGQQSASKSDLPVKLVHSYFMCMCFRSQKTYAKNTLMIKIIECDRLREEVSAASARLEVIERSERDLAEECAVLKSNFLSLSSAYKRERTHSEELSAELLALALTYDTLLQERERTHRHTLEVERVRALLSRTSQSRVRVRRTYTCSSSSKVCCCRESEHTPNVAMGREQKENKRAIQSTRHELSQQSATLIISQHQLKEATAEVSKLQNHLKELNREYRARLTRYIQEECVTVAGDGDLGQKLKGFVESMLEEVKTSYRSREEQLTKAIRSYRKHIQGLSNTYQQLLVAYRLQREQILALPEHALEAGPPEAHFSPAETELRGETDRELHRLREDKARLESQLKLAREKVLKNIVLILCIIVEKLCRVGLTQDAWNDVIKQLKEIKNSTQEAQERERVQLIARATVAEEQVSELKEYVDNHLGRYKLEITRLRRLLGSQEGRSNSARTHKPRPLHKSLKSSSYEI